MSLLCAACVALPASRLVAAPQTTPQAAPQFLASTGAAPRAGETSDAPGRGDSARRYNSAHVEPRFGGFHGSLGYVLLGFHTGAAVDADIFAWGRTERQDRLGLRAGVCYYTKGDVGGLKLGSPYKDLDLLLRSTSSGAWLRLDLLMGMTRHFTAAPEYLPAKWWFHFGADLRVKLVGDAFGVIIQWHDVRESGYAGMSVFLAWDRP